VLCIPCFDDDLFKKLTPNVLLKKSNLPQSTSPYSKPSAFILTLLTLFICLLSIKPTINLFSKRQLMNASFEPFHIVNTYGAFGHVGEVRREVIISGTTDKTITTNTQWKDYDFKGKPGNIYQRPPLISPYHYRLDWQIWFAAMGPYHQHPWVLHFVYKLLQNDSETIRLLNYSPFKTSAPTYIKIDLYEYHFTNKQNRSSAWWRRTYLGTYLPPVHLNHNGFREFLSHYGWIK